MSTNLLTTEQAAACLGISEVTLATWRRAGKGPNYSRLGHHTVRYDKAQLDAWLMTLLGPPQAPHDNSVGYWLGHMSGHLAAFKEAPSEARKDALLAALNDYRDAFNKGLKMPMTVPQPLRSAQSFSDWYHRQLDEALIMYRLDPSSTRMDAMQQHLQGFQDAVALGKVKPW